MSITTRIQRRLEEADGAYVPNHFLLSLDQGTPFVIPAGSGFTHDDAHLHVFVHEYWHYWQNLSTVSGVKSFLYAQKLLALFGDTLQTRQDGNSEGSAPLPAAHADEISSILELWFDMDGDPGPSEDWEADFELSFSVTQVNEVDATVELGGAGAPNPRVELDVTAKWPDGKSEHSSMILGALAIEESVAFMIEEQVRQGLTDAPASPVPDFPYRVVERLLDKELGAYTIFEAACLGTLALLQVHPGPALVQIARRVKQLSDRGLDEYARLNQIAQELRPQLDVANQLILDHDLPEIANMHRGRGLSEDAIGYFQRMTRRAFLLRRTSPLLDVQSILPVASAGRLMLLQQAFPPCDLLQERGGDPNAPGRDLLFSFDDTPGDGRGCRPTDYMRAFQAQQHFVFAHLDEKNECFEASDDVEDTCPFYTACDLALRRQNSTVCEKTPWRSWERGKPGCWYAVAVAATMGNVTVDGILRPD